jgi:transglutaminase-like putative cysteine protease
MRNHGRFARWKAFLAALAVCVTAGCWNERDDTSLPPVKAAIGAAGAPKPADALSTAGAANTSAQGHPKETWDAVYLAGVRVGYSRTNERELVENGQKLVCTDSTNSVTVNRAGQRTSHTIVSRTVETAAGSLIRFHTRVESGATPTDFTGFVEGNELVVETETAGKKTTTRLAWPAAAGGFLAMEQSLLRQPMRAGERRTVMGLLAVVNQPVAMELVADKFEPTQLLQHSEDLLRVECHAKLPDGKPIVERLWVNREGLILKRQIDALKQETFRTTAEIALADAGRPKFDLMLDTTVPTDRPLDAPHATRRARYRVHLKTNDPAQVFSHGGGQEITSLDPRTAEIVVRAIRPRSAGDASGPAGATLSANGKTPAETPLAGDRLPTDDDRAANNLIQSDNPKIVTMARSIAPHETDPWRIATQLEAAVKRHIRQADYSQAFASAADVVEHGKGDCTEHAVLLAALCRARGIPARVAIGLSYISAAKGFGYHMWNEVWIDGAWAPLDATLGHGAVGAAYLKLADSSLKGTAAFGTFLPVAQVIGQLKIEILEVE